jgi:tRNA(Ile)-lysidine synthase
MKLTIHNNSLPKEATVILGVSGGRDSMALCHALLNQRPDLTIIPAHVDHGLRASSADDAEFVEGMMARWELPCETYKPRAPKTGNTEAWGRDKRYEFFEKLRKKHKADLVLTAHHQDDDVETLIMFLLRGTRVKGLSGMNLQRGKLVRPLLFTARSEINEYAEHHDLPYRDDPTNKDETYTRNFLRNKVVPVLTHVYPDFPERWQGQKDYWQELQNYLESQAQAFLDENLSDEGLARGPYRELPSPVRSTVLELWFKQSTGERVQDGASINRWDEAILNWHSRKKTEWHEKKFLVMKKGWAHIL